MRVGRVEDAPDRFLAAQAREVGGEMLHDAALLEPVADLSLEVRCKLG